MSSAPSIASLTLSKGDKNKMSKLQMKMAFLVGLTVAVLLPTVKASVWNQKTVFTFSEAVEVPGQTLPAGTYVFKLANSHSSRHIVQVFNKEENRIFGTFLAIPHYQQRPSDKPIIKFDERAAGEPQAIKAWVFPGHNYGHEFVYPKNEALALAKANNVPVPAMPTELTSDTTKPVKMDGPEVMALESAPLSAESPNGDEVELTKLFAFAYAYHAPAPATEIPAKLPSTASSMPLLGIVALLSLGVAAVLRIPPARAK
jgi:hypothetical protein